jgi:hypothetical protein
LATPDERQFLAWRAAKFLRRYSGAVKKTEAFPEHEKHDFRSFRSIHVKKLDTKMFQDFVTR